MSFSGLDIVTPRVTWDAPDGLAEPLDRRLRHSGRARARALAREAPPAELGEGGAELLGAELVVAALADEG
jgi:hypothetical protein